MKIRKGHTKTKYIPKNQETEKSTVYLRHSSHCLNSRWHKGIQCENKNNEGIVTLRTDQAEFRLLE